MSAAAAWALPTDDDDRAELAEFGITLSDGGEAQFPDEQAQRDAVASQLLRRLGEMETDLKRYSDTKASEVALIVTRYERHTAPIEERKAVLASLLRQIALTSDFGKAKSRKLTYGVYGLRAVPERIAIEDSKTLLSWARLLAPDLVSEKREERVLQSAVEQHVKATGEIPDGVAIIDAHVDPFYKLDIPEAA